MTSKELSSKEFSEPVLENPPELSQADIERVACLSGFARERVTTVLEMSQRAGLGERMREAIGEDLVVILCALHGLSRQQVERATGYYDVPF